VDGRALIVKAEERSMRPYFESLVLGLGVGIIYGFAKIRSPAPPAIALLGLLGVLAGEQVVSLTRSYLFKSSVQLSPALRDRGEATISGDVRGSEGNERRF
jgi:XapX domain-containing protein